jgi:hypothetical protein
VRARGKLASGKTSPRTVALLLDNIPNHSRWLPPASSLGPEGTRALGGSRKGSYLVDPASSHMLVSHLGK